MSVAAFCPAAVPGLPGLMGHSDCHPQMRTSSDAGHMADLRSANSETAIPLCAARRIKSRALAPQRLSFADIRWWWTPRDNYNRNLQIWAETNTRPENQIAGRLWSRNWSRSHVLNFDNRCEPAVRIAIPPAGHGFGRRVARRCVFEPNPADDWPPWNEHRR